MSFFFFFERGGLIFFLRLMEERVQICFFQGLRWAHFFWGVEGLTPHLHRLLLQLIWDPNYLQHSFELVHLILQSPGLRGGGAGDWTRDWPQLGQLPRSRYYSLLQQCVHHEPVCTRWITTHSQGWPKN